VNSVKRVPLPSATHDGKKGEPPERCMSTLDCATTHHDTHGSQKVAERTARFALGVSGASGKMWTAVNESTVDTNTSCRWSL